MAVHWIPRDAARDIIAEACRTDRAPAVAIHVRPEVARRLGGRLPVVVDASLPRFPGFEIVREAPWTSDSSGCSTTRRATSPKLGNGPENWSSEIWNASEPGAATAGSPRPSGASASAAGSPEP